MAVTQQLVSISEDKTCRCQRDVGKLDRLIGVDSVAPHGLFAKVEYLYAQERSDTRVNRFYTVFHGHICTGVCK
jgi:hypothetical protein